MNNLWEQSNIQANCDLCGVDAPFYMPVDRVDMMALRFQLPYHLVSANGGALPIGANVRLSIVDEVGTTTLCNLGDALGGKFMFGRYLDATTKTAQYQLYFPVPLKSENGYNWSHAYVDVNVGQYLVINNAFTNADGGFTYGVDETPAIFQEIRPGRLVFPYRMPGFTLQASLDGVSVAVGYPYTGSTCAHENFSCWRVKLTLVFAGSGVTKEYYTKPFRVNRTCDDSVRLSGVYSGGVTDCNGYVHDGLMSPAVADLNRLFLRIPAVLNQVASRVKKTFNDKCFAVRGERQLAYRLNSDPVPSWFAAEAEGVVLANSFNVDNQELQTADSDQLFVGVDIPGYQYQYLDVPLTSCRCLLIYGC
jgi:hypothetical protein